MNNKTLLTVAFTFAVLVSIVVFKQKSTDLKPGEESLSSVSLDKVYAKRLERVEQGMAQIGLVLKEQKYFDPSAHLNAEMPSKTELQAAHQGVLENRITPELHKTIGFAIKTMQVENVQAFPLSTVNNADFQIATVVTLQEPSDEIIFKAMILNNHGMPDAEEPYLFLKVMLNLVQHLGELEFPAGSLKSEFLAELFAAQKFVELLPESESHHMKEAEEIWVKYGSAIEKGMDDFNHLMLNVITILRPEGLSQQAMAGELALLCHHILVISKQKLKSRSYNDIAGQISSILADMKNK